MPINNTFDEDRFVALLEDAITKVRTEEDPIVLTKMKKIFKKNVPFTLRNYVAAYLAKQASQGFRGGRPQRRQDGGSRNGDRFQKRERERPAATRRQEAASDSTATEARPAPRRVTIDEAYAATIFIGIGKNRRVYTRDLITLLMQVCKLDRERIGRIRNQENYSFVELFKDDVDDVIATLNGYNYHGRTLTVSYARKKDETDTPQEEAQQDAAADTQFGGSVQEEAQPNQEEATATNQE